MSLHLALIPALTLTTPLLANDVPDARTGVWWGDLDGDARPDALVVQPDGSLRLMHNAGEGVFEDVTARLGLGELRGHHMAAFADVNGDGRGDLFLPAWRGPSRLMVQQEDGTLADETEARGLPVHAEPLDARWLDVDGDGALDLWLTTLHDDLVYRNDGRGRFEKLDLGILSRGVVVDGTPGSVDEARAMRGVGAGPGAGGYNPFAEPICALGVFDQANPNTCLPASSVPTAGHLLAVGSSALVPNLNADLFDGMDSSVFSQLGNKIDETEITNGAVSTIKLADDAVTAQKIAAGAVGASEIATNAVTSSEVANDSLSSLDLAPNSVGASELATGAVTDTDVNAAAAIAGSKIVPDFGSQNVATLGVASIGNGGASPFKVKGDGALGADGYLGVQGSTDFDGVTSADWLGLEIGVAGISSGASSSDNYGVVGHSNGVGVRGEWSGDPTSDFAELGRLGVGLHASGSAFSAVLDGDVDLNGGVDVGGTLDVAGEVTLVENVRINVADSFDFALHVTNSTKSGAGLFSQSSTLAVDPALSAKGVAAVEAVLFRNSGSGTVIRSLCDGTASVVNNLERTTAHGSGLDMLEISIPVGSSPSSQFIECERAGNNTFRVDGDGDVFADGSYSGPADFAEMIAVSTGATSVEAGDVMAIDPSGERAVIASSEPYSRLVAGVYSTRPGFVGSEREFEVALDTGGEARALKREDLAALYDEVPVAVVGIVPCKVSGENGPIRPGDLLVTSSVPGHAMVDNDPPVGTVVGKALEPFAGERGVIRVLVTLQ